MAGSEFLNENGLSIGLATPAPEVLLSPNIGVIGIGGAGGNAVNNMVESGLSGVSFFVANTDAQALSKSLVSDKIQLGVSITKGLGAGAKPEVGKAAAEESADKLHEAIQNLHMLFITAGMGGGTGTGGAPVVAKLARELGILTVGVVSKPFRFEGNQRMKTADAGIAELQKYVDALIIVPNQNLFRVIKDNTTVKEAFKMADDVLCQGVRSITDLMLTSALVNLDFADIKTVLANTGRAMMGTGEAEGENRALIAAEKAISNPLLDDDSIKGARSILINIAGGNDLNLMEVDAVTDRVRSELPPEANIIFGTYTDENLDGKIRVSLVATGIDKKGESPVSEPVTPAPVQPQIVVTPPVQMPVVEEKPTVPVEQEQPDLISVATIMAEKKSETVASSTHVNVDVQVVQSSVVQEPPLFDEEKPFIAEAAPFTIIPEESEPVHVESKKSEVNVKAPRGGLFDSLPTWKRKFTREKNEKKDIPTMTDDTYEIPAFLRVSK